jgi:hypothetical protein
MSARLRQYLLDAYENRRAVHLPRKIPRDMPVQIDDQDDSDNLDEFCNIFCTIGSGGKFRIELAGNFPITREMVDLSEIYDGSYDPVNQSIRLQLNYDKVDVLMDLAEKIRKTAFMGDTINNSNWLRISARTISSLYRFVRIIKEYRNLYKV